MRGELGFVGGRGAVRAGEGRGRPRAREARLEGWLASWSGGGGVQAWASVSVDASVGENGEEGVRARLKLLSIEILWRIAA